VRDLRTFRDAYRKRRCIVPVDGFFEWKAIKGQKARQPYAIAMKDGAPFGIAGIWENWKEPASGEWIRTFAIITMDANTLVADIHDRMPVILSRYDYARWLSEEPDPHDLMRPFPGELSGCGQFRLASISRRTMTHRYSIRSNSQQMRPEGGPEMMDDAEKRGQLIRHLEDALALADEIQDGQTGYLIERALDEARSRLFRLIC